MKNKNGLFDIATLSDCVGCGEVYDHAEYNNLSDPIAIITGGVAILQSIFPNLFGGGRRELTSADWLMMFPGNGFWTVKLRNYLATRIHYDADLENIQPFTGVFVSENRAALQGSNQTERMQYFLSVIAQEKVSGGALPVGQIPGLPGTFNYQAMLPFLIGGIVLIMVLKKKK